MVRITLDQNEHRILWIDSEDLKMTLDTGKRASVAIQEDIDGGGPWAKYRDKIGPYLEDPARES